MYHKHRINWGGLGGINGVHAIGYPTPEAAQAAAEEVAREHGWTPAEVVPFQTPAAPAAEPSSGSTRRWWKFW